MNEYLASVEPYTGWDSSYQWAKRIRKAGDISRAYVTKAGRVVIRKAGVWGSVRDHAWQLRAYEAAMSTGRWDAEGCDEYMECVNA